MTETMMSRPMSPPPAAPPAAADAAHRRDRVLEWVRTNPELPTPPAIALRVIDRASDPACEPAELAEIISKDPALCAKVLRTVNSAVYGLRQPVTSVPGAVRFLGIHPLRSLVLAFTLSNIRWSPLPATVVRDHWRVSVAGALAARQLALHARRPAPDNHLVSGLVRDLGVFVLYQLFPQEYRTVLDASPESRSAFQCELEEDAIGINHAEVGAELLRLWHMPEDVTEPIRWHHDLERTNALPGPHRDGARLLYLASQIGQLQLTPHRHLLVREVLNLAKDEFHLDLGALQRFVESLGAQVKEFAAALEVDIGDSVDLAGVVSRGVEEFARLAVKGSGVMPTVRKALASRQPPPAEPEETWTGRAEPPRGRPSSAAVAHGPEGLGELLDRLFPDRGPPGEPLGLLGGYEVLEMLGCGTSGAVFRGHDPRLDRAVAIKALLPHRVGDEQAVTRFLQEGRAVAALTHENVVRVYAVGESNGIPYLVMEYVKGATLAAKLEQAPVLPLPDLLRLGLDTASGLSAAHAKQLVHRDIKPANLLVQEGTGRVKIADFGLVRMAGKAKLSHPGRVVGTPAFMSPEQAEGKAPDARSDMFSLGSVLYFASTGKRAFPGDSVMAVLLAVTEADPPPLRAVNPALPAWLEETVAGLLTKDPARRYPTAAELRRLLLSRWARLLTERRAEGGAR